MTAVAAVVSGYYTSAVADIPSPWEQMALQGDGARIYDRNGVLLYQFVGERGYQQDVSLDEVSPYVVWATIATEDASFYTNPGVNPKGLARAMFENLRPGDAFLRGTGGSSITQQLVKQLYETPEERSQRSVKRKLREIALALELGSRYPKDQILTWYLNNVSYGGLFTGIEAAARGYFGKPARDLTLPEAAYLAGLPQAPAEYDPFTHPDAAKRRQVEVLDLMVRHGYLTQYEADMAKLVPIVLRPQPAPFRAPHFVLYVADEIRRTLGEDALYRGGLRVITTLDYELQRYAEESLERWLSEFEASTNAHNGAVVVLDATNAEILAMVGSRNYFRADIQGENNNALALNSPGSTFKPFTYLTAFLQGWGPDWPLIDSPVTYREADGRVFRPENPQHNYYGTITLRQALGASLNVPAFKTALWVGVDNIVDTARRLGITTLNGRYGPSLTLGSGDVTLLDMAYAYSVFANNGAMRGQPRINPTGQPGRPLDPVAVLRVEDRQGKTLLDNTQRVRDLQVVDAPYAYLITDILKDDEARVATFGRNSVLAIEDREVAVKTGTSAPYEGRPELVGDTWAIGYSPDRVVGVWIGNSDNTPMRNIYSTTIAARVWRDVIVRAHEGLPPRNFVRPPGIVRATVCVPSGMRPTPACGRTVTGEFVAASLKNQPDDWWGRVEERDGRLVVVERGFRPPPDVTGYKRALAMEYAWGGGWRQEASQPVRAQPT
ncbi:MAG TPA: transglycosylase domain-containing protein, partial [Dehalococcoidia bacterium]|nr:transglycosylase domain-containing protein [Dehalococcoidia bacterium]